MFIDYRGESVYSSVTSKSDNKKSQLDQNTFFYWGYSSFFLNAYTEAIELFKKALEFDQENALAYFYLGRSYLYSGENDAIDDSIGMFKKTIDLEPENEQAYHFWGKALRLKMEYEEAVEKQKKAIKIKSIAFILLA